MLFRLFYGQDFWEALISALLIVPTVLISLSLHEAAHAFVANKCGDPTAKALGRLTLNPLKHLDPIGTVMMLLTGYGWAKPVPVNSRYFKNPKRGMALTALAGPMMNFLLGFLGAVAYAFCYRGLVAHPDSNLLYAAVLFFNYFSMLNIVYMVFNLIPIPPFDGSRILLLFLPTKWYFSVMKYERIIMMVVLIGFATGLFWSPVAGLSSWILDGIYRLIGLIF